MENSWAKDGNLLWRSAPPQAPLWCSGASCREQLPVVWRPLVMGWGTAPLLHRRRCFQRLCPSPPKSPHSPPPHTCRGHFPPAAFKYHMKTTFSDECGFQRTHTSSKAMPPFPTTTILLALDKRFWNSWHKKENTLTITLTLKMGLAYGFIKIFFYSNIKETLQVGKKTKEFIIVISESFLKFCFSFPIL